MVDLDDTLNEFEQLIHIAIRQSNKWTPCPAVSKQQFLLLHTLLHQGRMSVSELADELCLSASATTIAINRLVRDGHIARSRDVTDRRVVWIELSDAGRTMIRELRERRKSILQKMLADLPSDETRQFMSTLRKMLTSVTDMG
ncbi:MarR family transcriptional regulator [Paenibacillus doosanensis]|uniref:HTH-type transcriptional regulator YusO n=1 Tax=Paenibacillus konkukensis TaxID=2020716 RepID=A0ABY4RMJ7_9BACL|nr:MULTISPECIES: MarR family transcriptional regulator [Paenibacillus]MCS7462657.1 MarR family transcriptional regulator [Paenibacillus doosanensis]UQZ82522.1 putative HTH-type transcriptional regulator YusO [Paenibacillus konkukensis]